MIEKSMFQLVLEEDAAIPFEMEVVGLVDEEEVTEEVEVG
jgi:hypothetical protein